MKIKYFIFLAFLFPLATDACSPILPKIIPPVTPDGEFTYIYPPTKGEGFAQKIKETRNRAVVVVYIDHHYQSYPYGAQTEFKVLHGWGDPQPKINVIIRKEDSCGKVQPLKINSWYLALFVDPNYNPILIPYDQVKDLVELKGKSTYAHTSIGLLPR
ncbi:hypothetical protein [Microbulbifer spongiae]|uniref:Lipoprotein n=1 Tax=Microbulbifer spongiae TaxID=2944933 RepID=A0ABY9E9Y7_9GAMM|nr:hypothetical protein [Microbulbifer sp. MI-G]WKD48229.1 hypothetical protein M8T91_09780 [Microbulbifer sp. MI-G]